MGVSINNLKPCRIRSVCGELGSVESIRGFRGISQAVTIEVEAGISLPNLRLSAADSWLRHIPGASKDTNSQSRATKRRCLLFTNWFTCVFDRKYEDFFPE
jgi:hypothetical protein